MPPFGSSSSQSSPVVRTYDTKTLLIAGVACMLLACGILWLVNKMNEQTDVISTQRTESARLQERTSQLQGSTNQLEGTTSQLQETITQLKETTDQLSKDLRSQKDQTRELVASFQGREESLQKEIQQLRNELGSARSTVDMMEKAIKVRDVTIAHTSINTEQLIRRIDRIAQTIDSFRNDISGWNRTSEELLQSDRGQLGSSPDLVQAFVDLKYEPLVSDDELLAWKDSLTRLKAALTPIQNGTTEVIVRAPQGLETTVAEIESSVRTHQSRLTDIQEKVKRRLSNQSDTLPSNAIALREAIQQREDELRKERETTIATAAKEVRDALTQKLAAERIDTEHELAEKAKEFELKRREAQLAKQKMEHEIELRQLEDIKEDAMRMETQREIARRTEIERENGLRKLQAAMPEIEKYLVPFITPGNQQFNGREWSFSVTKAPVSYSAIIASGALQASPQGSSMLSQIATSAENDRPPGVFQTRADSRRTIRTPQGVNVSMVQELLREYGDLMVTHGILTK